MAMLYFVHAAHVGVIKEARVILHEHFTMLIAVLCDVLGIRIG